ncbi:hypothetical protein ATE92_1383 [Ulvibacter sp. MAR_2010_11]|uniref:MMPL family transporter n=1 Tax=Ulvibacter sp. MAR_2010_11 TaxID=1250229 RepID=UPI000C2CA169|nr:MMPL family transporter [Ulvibacter sp. MAR_2010_11]PKA83233.1 hypothetical protein ATE92_1383 [Ulvibacter sp. MAR_2010_11]
MHKGLYQIYSYLKKRPFVFGLSLLLVFGSLIAVATQIRFEEDISRLIPTTSQNKALQKVLQTANFSDKIIVNIRREPEGTLEDLTNFAETFIDSISEANDYIQEIQGKVEEEIIFETLDFVYENAPLFLSDHDYSVLADKISKDSIDALTEANYKTLVSPSGIVAKKTIVKDPLGISLMGVQKLKLLGLQDGFILKEGFLVSKDENNLLLFLTPKYDTGETDKNEQLAAYLDELKGELNSEFFNRATVEYFGGAIIAVENAKQIKNDILLTVGIALSLLLLVFIYFYKKLIIPVILLIPTIFGGLVALVILWSIRPEISAISLGIGSVLLGVTLDYSLHILTHIRNHKAMDRLFIDVTKPILMSSLTTAMAFLCLLFIDSQALQDLGIFAAVSVLSASVFALIFIPQVYKGAGNTTQRHTFLDLFAAYPFHKNKIFITAIVLLIIISAFTYNSVIFNKDLSQLNYESPSTKKAQYNLEKLTGGASKSLYVIAFGDDLESVLENNDTVFETLQQRKVQGEITGFNSIGGLVNSRKTQLQKINNWDTFWTVETINNTQNQLIESGAQFGFKSNTFQEFYALLQKDFVPLNLEDYKQWNGLAIDDFIASKDNFYTVTTLVKIPETSAPLVKDAFKDNPDVLVIDRQEMNETLLGNLKNDFNKLIMYCLGIVVLLLFLFYRNIRLTVITVLPIIITWFITIGLMGLFNIEFNIFNVIISTFIFGLGVDYSIFTTNGLLQEEELDMKALITHKTAILLSVITTMMGIGVLVFAKHPALYSISLVSMIGIFSTLIITFTLQPLFFKFIYSNSKKGKHTNGSH